MVLLPLVSAIAISLVAARQRPEEFGYSATSRTRLERR
jgi:hypothetical protein